ncbi:MAG: hypothetical protein Q9227_004354 [Pyrenula ochraceoflavens]
MGTGPHGKAFLEEHDLDKRPYSFSCDGPQFVDRSGNVTRQLKAPLNLTSWDVLYYRLRANFDGLSSGYCPSPPSSLETGGDVTYNLGKRVTAISCNGDTVTVTFENVISGGTGTYHAHLVIAADGSNSTIRKLLAPKAVPKYCGYLAWRGTVPEAEVSDETRKFFDKGFFSNVLPGNRGYLVGYAMPGKDGTLERGCRAFNFVWYSKLPPSSALQTVLTDSSGHRHHNTLPRGRMDPGVWKRQFEPCKEVMLPAFREVCENVKEPFISAVNDCTAPSALYFNGKVILLGEALALIRPHTGISFDTAAFQVLQLKRVMEGQSTLDEWQEQVNSNNRKAELFALVYGRFLLYGALRPSFLVTSASLHAAFQSFTTDSSLFALPITITSESLTPLPPLPFTSSSFAASLPTLAPHLTPKDPIYLFLRRSLEASTFAAVTYVPANAPVRAKTLFASTRSTLLRELGLERFEGSYFCTDDFEVLDAKEWEARDGRGEGGREGGGKDEAILTREERELQGVKRAEEEERHGTGGRDIGWGGGQSKQGGAASGLKMKVGDGVGEALRGLGEEGCLAQMAIDLATETVTLSRSKSNVSPSNLSSLIPSSDPSYTFYHYPSTPSIVFIYSCPSTTSVKGRMVYASSRNSVVQLAKDEDVEVSKRIEVGGPEDVTETSLRDEVMPKAETETKQGFARPKRPGRR